VYGRNSSAVKMSCIKQEIINDNCGISMSDWQNLVKINKQIDSSLGDGERNNWEKREEKPVSVINWHHFGWDPSAPINFIE
jgi:hypothetical protein